MAIARQVKSPKVVRAKSGRASLSPKTIGKAMPIDKINEFSKFD